MNLFFWVQDLPQVVTTPKLCERKPEHGTKAPANRRRQILGTLLSDLSCTPPGRSACWAGFCTCHRLPRWCIWKQHDTATKTTEAHLICHWNVEISMNFWGGNGPLPFCLVCLLYMVQVSIKAQPPPEQTAHPNHQPVIRLPIRFFCYIYNINIYIDRTIKCKWWILH